MPRSRLPLIAAVAAITSTVAAATLGFGSRDQSISVLSSITPLSFIVEELGGARVTATTLLPPRADPHSFSPTPADIKAITAASLFVRVGQLDDWTDDLLAMGNRRAPVLTILGTPELAAFNAGVESGEPSPAEEPIDGLSSRLDPHVWLDPILVKDAMVPALLAALTAVDPQGEPYYRRRAEIFSSTLLELDEEIRQILSRAKGKVYVAYHGAWSHMARRYGLAELGVVSDTPGVEPTTRSLARLVSLAKKSGIPAIIVEPQSSNRVPRTIAAEFGGITVVADPLGDPRDLQRNSYTALMRFNANAFAAAMGGAW